MKRLIESDERTTKGMDNEGSDSRSWIGRWNCTHNNNHHTLCNTYYSFFTMPWDTRMSLVGWSPLISIAIDGMERENTKSSHRINMESFPLPFTPKTILSLSPSSLHHHRQSFTLILTILLSRACDSTPFIKLNKQSVHLYQSRNHSFCLFIPPSPKHTLLIDSSPARFPQTSFGANMHLYHSIHLSMGP